MELKDLKRAIDDINIEDLRYVEKDLCFYESVSLGFLLYGVERVTSELALQKLLVSSKAVTSSSSVPKTQVDLLYTYAFSINKTDWRQYIVEALAIINARRLLRKLGLKWEIVRQHFLPHVCEFSLHIHPLLKALYKICDQMNQMQSMRLISYMSENYNKPNEYFPFFDSTCLEVFLLDWITRRIISVGGHDGNNAKLNVLFEYFKLNDMDEAKTILIETINHNVAVPEYRVTDSETPEKRMASSEVTIASNAANSANKTERNPPLSECYEIRYEQAGFVLIINQEKFHQETKPEFQHLLPKRPFGPLRAGTDLDKARLSETFASHGYRPIEYDNLDHLELLSAIRETAKRSLLYDSFIVCILSHGFDGAVYGANSIPVPISEIEEILTLDTLTDKPKLLIIQACQIEEKNANITTRKTPNAIEYADILKAMSTVSGFPAFRDTKLGSWFITALCDAIKEIGNQKHLSDIITSVIRNVSAKRGGKEHEVMLPMMVSTLRNFFFLPPKKEIS